jgi:tetratricopeptide (TPR) repeat protein
MPDNTTVEVSQAFELLDGQKYAEALAIFCRLISEGRAMGESLYGLALVNLARKDVIAAKRLLEGCLTSQPGHANACYYLGHISESLNERDAAIVRYQQAIQFNPQHSGALARLKVLGAGASQGLRVDPGGISAVQESVNTAELGGHDFYGLLHRSSEPVEQEITRLLDDIESIMQPRRARVRASLGRFLILITAVLVLPPVAMQLGSAGYMASVFGVFVLAPLYAIWTLLAIRGNRLSCKRYIVIRESGVLMRKTYRDHLWLMSRDKPQVVRSLLNRMTNDGRLAVGARHYHGFFRGEELERLQANMTQLSLLMPTSRTVLSAMGELKNIRSGG